MIVAGSDLEDQLGSTSIWREGVRRHQVQDVDLALDEIARLQPRLVILDWPDSERLAQLIIDLRTGQSCLGGGIAVLSRSMNIEEEEDLISVGASIVIPVPVNQAIWSKRLETLLNVPPRRSMRTPVNVAIWALPGNGGDGELRGMAVNIGPHGLLLESERPLTIGAKADLRFRLPGSDEELHAVGDVVWKEDESRKRYRCGIEFIVMQGLARERVESYVNAFEAIRVDGEAGEEPAVESDEWKRELRASEARTRAILNSDPTAIVTVDVDGKILEFNRAAVSIFGFERRDVVGKTATELLVPPDLLEAFHRVSREYLASGSPLMALEAIETRAKRRDGRELPIELTVSPAMVKERLMVTAFIRDLTGRKAAEEQRRLLELQVLQKQKLESLGVLASGIAHDLNNLLVGMLGHADLALLELGSGSSVESDLEGIITAATRAGELCERLLAYGGRRKVEKVPVDLNQLVEEMVSLIEISVLKKAEIRFELYPRLPMLDADPTQLRQVILNLVTNAAESLAGSTNEEIIIATGLTEWDFSRSQSGLPGSEMPEGTYVFVQVSDSGSGIETADMERIFDPFFTTKLEGRGLGLAAVLGIVRGHGGTIEVESGTEPGTVMRVILPPAVELDTQPKPESGNDQESLEGKVLLVDDEDVVRNIARRMLEQGGLSVITARNGAQALEILDLSPDRFLFVMLDVHMPKMNGQETFDRLRRIRPDLPVLFSSGFGERELLERIEKDENADFIRKPYRKQKLLRIVRRLLHEAKLDESTDPD